MDEMTSPARSTMAVALLIALGALSTHSLGPAAAHDRAGQAKPMEVTSDTPEYCLQLLDRVSEMVRVAGAPVPQDVTDLTTEGHRMCAHGQTRGGIMRLRSALMIMEKSDPASSR